ncbi:MAG TPA: hypothetical protein VGS27_16260 [Candidatus Sulfotelmatobacter sp.]|nr:hypothetical protein [Candidatus Sulfotelmatobacter sp.]
MHVRTLAIPLFIVAIVLSVTSTAKADDRDSLVIIYKDGHRQTLMSNQIARIDLKAPAAILYKDGHREKLKAEIERIEFGDVVLPARAHFIGKWEVGDGAGHTFFITLEPDGDARKSIGTTHGTWTLVDGEAHIAWDDGWHDALRKVGSRHEKVAYEPGRTFGDDPSNVTEAHNTERKPI